MRNLLYIVLFLGLANSHAQEKSLFDQATQDYADKNYTAAIQQYDRVLAGGKTSTAVYFNLGNAYYKIDSLAPSIFYYNKALQRSPRDQDVKNNLLFAKRATIDAIESTPPTGWTKFWGNIISVFGYDAWAIFAVAFSVLVFIFGSCYYFIRGSGYKRLFFTLSAVALVLGVLSVVFAYQQYNSFKNNKYAIVFALKKDVHTAPNQHAPQTFTLHEGTKVKVLDNFNGFSKIELADGKQGWILKKAIKGLWLDRLPAPLQ